MGMKVEPSYKVVAYWDGLPVSLTLLKKIAPGGAFPRRVHEVPEAPTARDLHGHVLPPARCSLVCSL